MQLMPVRPQLTPGEVSAFKKMLDDVLTHMVRKYSFYASIQSQARLDIDTNIPTAAMGVRNTHPYLVINPTWFMQEKFMPLNRVAVCIHEVEHFTRRHHARKGTREHQLYNIACDIVVNGHIENLPEGAQTYEMYKLKGPMSEEQVYAALLKIREEQEQERNPGGGQPAPEGQSGQEPDQEGGDPISGGQPSGQKPDTDSQGRPWLPKPGEGPNTHPTWEGDDKDPLSEEIHKRIIEKAVKQAGKGNVPGHLQEIIEEILAPPKISWKQLLREYVGAALRGIKVGTYLRMNRRGFPLLKGRMMKNGKNIVLVLDTSGSMGSEELNEAINELRHLRKLKEANVWLLMVDAEVAWSGKIEKYGGLPKQFEGRGGTDFRPAFEWAEKKGDVDLLIYFTDGAGDYPEHEPRFPVIWLMTEKSEPRVDWGRVIHYHNN